MIILKFNHFIIIIEVHCIIKGGSRHAESARPIVEHTVFLLFQFFMTCHILFIIVLMFALLFDWLYECALCPCELFQQHYSRRRFFCHLIFHD